MVLPSAKETTIGLFGRSALRTFQKVERPWRHAGPSNRRNRGKRWEILYTVASNLQLPHLQPLKGRWSPRKRTCDDSRGASEEPDHAAAFDHESMCRRTRIIPKVQYIPLNAMDVAQGMPDAPQRCMNQSFKPIARTTV